MMNGMNKVSVQNVIIVNKNRIMKNKETIVNEILNELYLQYEAENSMETVRYLHPMFYNGTFSKNNEYQPEKPEPLLTKDEFFDKMNKNSDFKWGFAFQSLFIYISKQEQLEL